MDVGGEGYTCKFFLLKKAIKGIQLYLREFARTLDPEDMEKDPTIVIVIWPKPES